MHPFQLFCVKSCCVADKVILKPRWMSHLCSVHISCKLCMLILNLILYWIPLLNCGSVKATLMTAVHFILCQLKAKEWPFDMVRFALFNFQCIMPRFNLFFQTEFYIPTHQNIMMLSAAKLSLNFLVMCTRQTFYQQ